MIIVFVLEIFILDSISHLSNCLLDLSCGGYSGINQNGITELKNIKKIYLGHNHGIKNVNHLANTNRFLLLIK